MCADITCCNGLGCNLKKNCYRFTANKNEYAQSYFLETPKKIADAECEYFIGNTDYYKSLVDKPEELKKQRDRIGDIEPDKDVKLPF